MIEQINNSSLSIKSILANDILEFAKDMNLTKRAAIADISSNTKIGTATLERILDSKSKITPFPKTVSLIYSYIFNATSYVELLSKVEESIASYIKEAKHDIKNGDLIKTSLETISENNITNDHIFNQIYLLTSGEFDISIDFIKDLFGSNGLKKIDFMITNGYLKLTDDNNLIRGERKISWNRNTILNFSNTLNNEIIDRENFDLSPENIVHFYVGTCSERDAQQIKCKIKELMEYAKEITSKTINSNEEKVKIALSSTMGAIINYNSKGMLQ